MFKRLKGNFMTGYYGYSKSNNAIQAENLDRYPISIASQIMAKKTGWSKAKAKAFLQQMGTSEYHHTSKKYNTTWYYDVSDEAIDDLKDEISEFVYTPEKKEKRRWEFKSWNFQKEHDPRKWQWSITKRDGNYLLSLKNAKTMLLKHKTDIEKKQVKIGSKSENLKNERLKVISEILAEIEFYEKENEK